MAEELIVGPPPGSPDLIDIQDESGEVRYLMPEEFQKPDLTLARGVFGDTAGSPDLILPAQWKPVSLKGIAPPILDQNGIGACHVDDTEVLTANGWVAFTDYNGKDLLATVDPVTHQMQFQAPTRLQAYDYVGEVIHSTNRRLDFGVTPEHRMLVRKWDESARTLSKDYSFTTAGALGWYTGLLDAPSGFLGTGLNRVTIPGDREYDGNDFVSLLALLSADGFAGGSEASKNRVSFCNFRPERNEWVVPLAHRLGFTRQESRPSVWYRTDAGALAAWVRQNVYTSSGLGSPNKKVPDILKWVTEDQIRLFLSRFGDRKHSDDEIRFYSSSKRLIDDLQELHLRIGKRSSICSQEPREGGTIDGRVISGKSPAYTLCVAEKDRLCLDRKKHIERDSYRGKVFCATVPNGTLVTRRNGSVLISGNCNPFATIETMHYARALAGMDYLALSPGDLYRRICGGTDRGSLLEDAIKEVSTRGACLASICPMLQWQKNMPGADANRPFNVVTEWWTLPTTNHLASAIQRGFASNIGIMWFDGDKIDGDGWLPMNPGGRKGGHAICRATLEYRNGKWGIGGPNSWGTSWGKQGWMTVPLERLKANEGTFGWFCCRQVTYLPNAEPLTPLAV